MLKILIVEDEKPISDLLKLSLMRAGYSCQCIYDGTAAADLLESGNFSFDLILLDVMLPGVDGFELMEYISPLEIPVIFITAKNSVVDRVRGLKMGADDYIVKPFEIVELLARVEAVLRRNHKIDSYIEMADLQIDLRSRVVKKDGQEIVLTKRNLIFLFCLCKIRERLCTGKLYMNGYGAEIIPETAERWISMCKDCGKRPDGKTGSRRCIK